MTASPAATVASPLPGVAADLLVVPARARVARDLVLILAGSLLVAASAQIAFPIPGSPVPVTMQTFAVLLVGALLGPTRGAAALVAYLAEGACGLPVFANFSFGVHTLLGPTGGYLLAFVPAAWLTGWLAVRGWDRSVLRTLAAMSLGTTVILTGGVAWLTLMVEALGGSIREAAMAGLWPFLPGAVFKIALAAALLPAGWSLLRWFERPRG